jgi:hypothetical protein
MLVISFGVALTVALLSTVGFRSGRRAETLGSMSPSWIAAHLAAEQAWRP